MMLLTTITFLFILPFCAYAAHTDQETEQARPRALSQLKPVLDIPADQDGSVRCSADQNALFVFLKNNEIQRIDLRTKKSETVDLNDLFKSLGFPKYFEARRAIHHLSDDGRYAVTYMGQVIDLASKPPKAVRELSERSKEEGRGNLKGYEHVEPREGFAQGTHQFMIKTDSRAKPPQSSWKLIDLDSGSSKLEVTLPGHIANFSPDYRFVLYVNNKREAIIRNLSSGEEAKVAKGVEDISATFRGNQATLVDWRQDEHQNIHQHILLRVDLDNLRKGAIPYAGEQTFDERGALMKEALEHLGGRTTVGRAIRVNPYSEMYEPIGDSRLAFVDGRLFDAVTGNFLGKAQAPTELSEDQLIRDSCKNLQAYADYNTTPTSVKLYPIVSLLANHDLAKQLRKIDDIKRALYGKSPSDFLNAVEAIRSNLTNPVLFLKNEAEDAKKAAASVKLDKSVSLSSLISQLGAGRQKRRDEAGAQIHLRYQLGNSAEREAIEGALLQAKSKFNRDPEIRNRAEGLLRRLTTVTEDSAFKAARVEQAQALLDGLIR